MIIGDPAIFAIESEITRAYKRLSLRAMGFFLIHVSGRTYGQSSPDSTMLACSFDAIESASLSVENTRQRLSRIRSCEHYLRRSCKQSTLNNKKTKCFLACRSGN